MGFAMKLWTSGQSAFQTYFANSAVRSPQVTFSLMLLLPMVTSTNQITGSVKASTEHEPHPLGPSNPTARRRTRDR